SSKELEILLAPPKQKSRRHFRYRMPAWLGRVKNVMSTYWAHWFLGFVAGYLVAALLAAPHWRQIQ
ncbi:hypothetical protein, partial [Pelotomaculum propionicicum]|uniref:hypothetical protein n=1 Tax=Pelotomaculum propionicicum TaxID=258475 RepID=UPI0018652BF1